MTIKVGDQLPDVTLKHLVDGALADIQTGALFAGRRVVLFSVPGAYTPTCSRQHLPGYVARADELREQGVDEIICLSINDPWVMRAWGEDQRVGTKVRMLPDGNGEFTAALGLVADMTKSALGQRGKRFSMVVDDGIVITLQVEPARGITISGAETCLTGL